MALTNCSINSASLIKTGGQAIGSQNATLTITPDAGFVVEATDFSVSNVTYASNGNSLTWTNGQNGVSLPTGVTSITLANSTSANAIDNTITVTVDLTDSYSMPSDNTTLIIDIDGAASLIQYTVAGAYTTNVSNATPSSESTTSWNASGTTGSTVTISSLSKTFTASTGHHFENEPSVIVTAENENRYTITKQREYTNGRLTEVTFNVTYTFSSESESAALFEFFANAVEFFTEVVEISSYAIVDATLSSNGDSRAINIFGTNTAQVKLSISNSAGNTYNFSSDTFDSTPTDLPITISSTGIHTESITFPTVTSTETYTFTLDTTSYSNGINSTIDADSNGIVTFTLSQPAQVSITLRPTHGDARISISQDKVVKFLSGIDATNLTDSNLKHIFEISTVDGPLRILSQPSASSFTNTASGSNNGTTINITSAVLSQTEDKIYLAIGGNIGVVGTADVISQLDLSNNLRIQNKTIAFGGEVNCFKGKSVLITLKSTDLDGDTMTHAIVDNPTTGSLSTLTTNEFTAGPPSQLLSDITYTNTGTAGVYTDFIRFKANDGTDDSEVKTITINIINSAPVATDQPTGISCERGGSTGRVALNVTDADDALSDLSYDLITPPLFGEVTFDGKGNFKYVNDGEVPPTSNGNNQDTFVYEVSDGIESDQATVTIDITSEPDANDLERPCVQNQSTGLIILEGSSPTDTAITYSLTTAPTRGSLFYNSALTTPSGGISVGNLSASQVYYKNNGVSDTDDEFKYRVTDSNGLASRIATVEIPVSAPAVSSFYNNDSQTSASALGSTFEHDFMGNAAANTRTITSYSMIIIGSSNATYTLSAKKITGVLQSHFMEITLWNASPREYDEATTGSTHPIRVSWTGTYGHSTNYAFPWGNMTVPPGLYFIKIVHTRTFNGGGGTSDPNYPNGHYRFKHEIT